MWLAPPAVAFPESPTTGDPANWRRTGSANYVLAMRSHQDGVEVRRRLGCLPAELALFPRLTGQAILKRAAHIRRHIGHRYRGALADRFGTELDRPVRTLSRQRAEDGHHFWPSPTDPACKGSTNPPSGSRPPSLTLLPPRVGRP